MPGVVRVAAEWKITDSLAGTDGKPKKRPKHDQEKLCWNVRLIFRYPHGKTEREEGESMTSQELTAQKSPFQARLLCP
ncbi:hypothetical protein BH20ACI3_BH20ACI3_39690 [soil metagenome]